MNSNIDLPMQNITSSLVPQTVVVIDPLLLLSSLSIGNVQVYFFYILKILWQQTVNNQKVPLFHVLAKDGHAVVSMCTPICRWLVLMDLLSETLGWHSIVVKRGRYGRQVNEYNVFLQTCNLRGISLPGAGLLRPQGAYRARASLLPPRRAPGRVPTALLPGKGSP